jgi:hypothetical protein
MQHAKRQSVFSAWEHVLFSVSESELASEMRLQNNDGFTQVTHLPVCRHICTQGDIST